MNLSTAASIADEAAAASRRSVGYGKRTDTRAIAADVAVARERMTAIDARRQAIARERAALWSAVQPKAEAAMRTAAAVARQKTAGFAVEAQDGQAVARAKAASDDLLAAGKAALDMERRLAAEDAELYAQAVAIRTLVEKLDDEAVEARKPFKRHWGGRH